MKDKITEIINFINDYVNEDEKIVVAVSGGLDSDVVARLCVKAVGNNRVKIFMVLQDDMDERHIHNALKLAADLNMDLPFIDMRNLNTEIIERLSEGDSSEGFNVNSLLETARAKCSLRTVLLSSYQEKGYIVAGTSNKTEIELGFFLPFGDNIAHFKPIAHLYKSEVKEIAKELGTNEEVLKQPASAGFWKDQEDLEDIAYWIYYKGPIPAGTQFNDEDDKKVMGIKQKLTTAIIDDCIKAVLSGEEINEISVQLNVDINIIEGIESILKISQIKKKRELLKTI
ncbi:MAG: NAD(+) synthase [Lachnospiraceae bacterium]|nr:NAD(+) synthase [Lachnospiraceae bacterium]